MGMNSRTFYSLSLSSSIFFFLRLLIKLEACEQHGLTQVIRDDSNVLKLGLGEGRTSSPGHNQPA